MNPRVAGGRPSTPSSALLHKAGLTAGGLGPALLLLTGMELGPFREDAGVGAALPLATADGLLREEVGEVAAGVFFFYMKRGKMNTKQKIG